MIDTTNETPEAWVGCLACYNGGRLVGAWMDGTEAADRDRFEELVGDVGEGEGSEAHTLAHEELWVMDFQGYGGFLERECSPVEAQRIAEAIEAIPDYIERAAVAAWLANTGDTLTDWADISEAFEDSYAGEWSSEVEYAQDFAEGIGAVDDSATWPNDCIDWERAARELFMDYWSADAPGGIYVFRS